MSGRPAANDQVGSRARRTIWLVAAFGIVAIGVLAGAYVVTTEQITLLDAFSGLALLVSLLAFVVSGAVIVSRQPRNVIGCLLMVPGLTFPLSALATQWLVSLHPPPTTVGPGLWLLLWSTSVSWVLLVFPIFHLLLTFPTGRPLTPRWRGVIALEAGMVGTLLVVAAFGVRMGPQGGDGFAWTVPNPIGILETDFMDSVFGTVWELGLIAITTLSAIAIVLRFRRGTSLERQQLKWPLAAACLFGVIYAAAAVQAGFTGGSALQGLFGFGLAAIPISVAVAILRYRLYEIDRIVSRTIGWAIVTGTLIGVFVLGVIALQTALSQFTQGETIAVTASTLLAFALFQPLRRRVQLGVDRRFDRARYDGRRTTDAFAERLRGEVEIDVVAADLEATIEVAVRPATQGLWLRAAGR